MVRILTCNTTFENMSPVKATNLENVSMASYQRKWSQVDLIGPDRCRSTSLPTLRFWMLNRRLRSPYQRIRTTDVHLATNWYNMNYSPACYSTQHGILTKMTGLLSQNEIYCDRSSRAIYPGSSKISIRSYMQQRINAYSVSQSLICGPWQGIFVLRPRPHLPRQLN
jgi:hypothetical protein